jgi:phenylalanyl-tRNA synthetase beta chain
MPVISIDIDDLCALLGEDMGPKELMELIPKLGADIEEASGYSLDVEFYPNRPDLYSVEGVARALRAYLGKEPGLKEYHLETSDIVLKVDESTQPIRPVIVSGLVRNIKFTDPFIKSLMEVQEKLDLTLGRKRKKVSIGVHDIDRVVPPFTYKCVDPESIEFVPLAFDEAMDMSTILRKHPKGIDYGWILDGFDKYPIITDANQDVVSFPPIINGILTTVTEKTENIFLDITGLDRPSCLVVLNILATMLAERGGQIHTVRVEYPDGTVQAQPDLVPHERTLSCSYTNKFLNSSFSAETLAAMLEKMGHSAVPAEDGEGITVRTPAYRWDVIHEVDLVEDAAIAFGYENFETELPRALTFGEPRQRQEYAQKMRTLMVGLDFTEIMSLSLSSPQEQFEMMGLEPTDHVQIKNPASEEHTTLRKSLLPSLLNILRTNKHRDLPQRVFEVGEVVSGTEEGGSLDNRLYLGAVAISAKANFTDIKSIVEAVLRGIGGQFELESKEHNSFIEGRCAKIVDLQGTELGVFGELHPRTITAFDLGYPVVGFEMDIESL